MRRAVITAIAVLALAGCASPEPPATATAAASVSPACRAWIAGELQDATDSIDADAGNAACAGLTEAEFDQAVDEVTGELLASAAAQ